MPAISSAASLRFRGLCATRRSLCASFAAPVSFTSVCGVRRWWAPATYLAWIVALVVVAVLGRWDAVIVSIIGTLIYLRVTWGIRRGKRERQELRAIKDRQRQPPDLKL
jgi:hypothetical protein